MSVNRMTVFFANCSSQRNILQLHYTLYFEIRIQINKVLLINRSRSQKNSKFAVVTVW